MVVVVVVVVHLEVHVPLDVRRSTSHVHVTLSNRASRLPAALSPLPDTTARNPADPGRSELAARLQ